MKRGREREKKETKSFKRERTLQIETSDKGKAAGAGPLIITDTLHYPGRNVHTDVFVCMCVLVRNDRRV